MTWEIPNEDAARDIELNKYLDEQWERIEDEPPCDDLGEDE